MNRLSRIILPVFCLLLGTSCVRTSTIISVKKDGTGTIVSRYYFSPQMLAMIDQLGSFGGGAAAAAGSAGGPNLGILAEMAKPEEESLRKDASNYGEGVHYTKHEAGKDEEGWQGYAVTYDFDDIRKLRIDQSSVPGKAKEFVAASGQEIKNKGGNLTFALEGDVLTVKSTLASAGIDGMIDQEQLDQAKQLGMKPSESMKMAAGMTAGMRVSFFLRAPEGIAETSAQHVTGDLIILSDADISKMLVDPDFGAFVDQVTENPEAVTPAAVKELFPKIEAMTIESSDQFTVKLK
ncbi:MAG: hypothetical protein KA250_03790 [Verrucomicrobiales bacterium]|jgi:hypothetical protein|nr:hypothetical protein [Verrucomicrobiales bacterium]MBP9226448.1 hypothetical protein [Verrucomicrobiales bacterium]